MPVLGKSEQSLQSSKSVIGQWLNFDLFRVLEHAMSTTVYKQSSIAPSALNELKINIYVTLSLSWHDNISLATVAGSSFKYASLSYRNTMKAFHVIIVRTTS